MVAVSVKRSIGALGTVSTDIEKWLAEIGVTFLESLQSACSVRVRKVLDTQDHGLRKTPETHLEPVFNEDNNNIFNNDSSSLITR